MNANHRLWASMMKDNSDWMQLVRPFLRVAALILPMISTVSIAQEKITAEQLQFFETKIRPVLVEKCYSCHSAKSEEVQGGLLLDTREGIRRGGDSGAAVVPGNLQASLLISAIRYTNDDLAMPPKDNGGKLPDKVVQDFEAWVRLGAADPREGSSKVVTRYNTEQARSWWSFQPLKPVVMSSVKIAGQHADWPQTEIDRLVAAQWGPNRVSPVADAEPQVLIRRLRFDLTGLPPGEKETTDFVKRWQSTPDARQTLLRETVDRLLESREYAERWGRHWLDVARYAESSGKDANLVYPHAWRYRDYVVEAFHKNKPFDQFVREQIAGDLLPAKNESQRAEQLIATGFLAIGENPINERNPKQFAVDLADDQIAAVTQAFLGQTVACARCHDHRFDPISQRDYTALAGIFLSTETKYGTPGAVGGRNRAGLIELPVAARLPVVAAGLTPSEVSQKQQRLQRLQEQHRAARAQRANGGKPTDGLSDFDVVRIATQVSQLEFELGFVNADGSAKALAMGVGERPAATPIPGRPMPGDQPFGPVRKKGSGPGRPMPPGGAMQPGGPMAGGPAGRRQQSSGFEIIGDSPLFLRGSIENVGEPVPRGIPALLGSGQGISIRSGSGRLELANALVSPKNTLTSRVIVNRIWHWMFGRGLVESVDNFGTTGARASHPELLDDLAIRFVREGWSIKQLIREITLSRTYRLSSTYDATSFAADPENAMLWRHSPRRLEAEEIRDAILAASGQLDLRSPPASMIGRAGDGPIGGERFQAVTLDRITGANHNYRSLYLPATRSVQPEVLSVFDPPNSSATDGTRDSTNVPSQALFMLNSDFVTAQSQALAELVIRSHPANSSNTAFPARLTFVFRRVLNRDPTASESVAAQRLVSNFNNERAAWTSVGRSLFGLAEFRLVD